MIPANYPATAADYLELARLEADAAFALGPVRTLNAEDRGYAHALSRTGAGLPAQGLSHERSQQVNAAFTAWLAIAAVCATVLGVFPS